MTARRNEIAADLLAWYDRHRRQLPWRAPPGVPADPYLVWLSEIMLQQTTVVAVADYFRRFVERWPTIDQLAAASLDEVLHAWQGLGYYARARNLHKCARVIAGEHAGRFPDSEDELRKLPGLGAYTAAALAAIAFGRRAVVVDGNVERVIARLFAIEDPPAAAKAEVRARVDEITPEERSGDYAQAMMDLGATICTPRKPRCLLCPVSAHCEAYRLGIAEELPRAAPKAERPVRHGVVFWAERPDGSVLLRRRAERGLLGGMMEVPSTEWREDAPTLATVAASAPVEGKWQLLRGRVQHGFTHFQLQLKLLAAEVPQDTAAPDGAVWVAVDRMGDHALPTLTKKVVAHAVRAVRQAG